MLAVTIARPDRLVLPRPAIASPGPLTPREQKGPPAESREGRLQKLRNYLRDMRDGGLIPRQTVDLARRAWHVLDASLGKSLPVPDACVGPDGKLLYSWSTGPHYLELEIIPQAAAEFFYQNDLTGELWDYDYIVGNKLPESAIAKLRIFTAENA
jgi:hypothetical protein